MKNIAVLISGGGTNMQAVIDACKRGEINGAVKFIISSNAEAYGLVRAKTENIPSAVFCKKDFLNHDELGKAIISELDKYNIDLVVLAGYLVRLSENIVNKYEGRMINVHPSLIPAFCGDGFYGMRVHEAAWAAGVKLSGATVHFVDNGMDTGPIIMQESVPLEENDEPENIQKKVLAVEHKILVKAVKLFCENRISFKDDGRVTINRAEDIKIL